MGGGAAKPSTKKDRWGPRVSSAHHTGPNVAVHSRLRPGILIPQGLGGVSGSEEPNARAVTQLTKLSFETLSAIGPDRGKIVISPRKELDNRERQSRIRHLQTFAPLSACRRRAILEATEAALSEDKPGLNPWHADLDQHGDPHVLPLRRADRDEAKPPAGPASLVPLSRPSVPVVVTFDRHELREIMNVYGRRVAEGEWRDYAIDFTPNRAVFSIFKRTSEVPLYRIEKDPKLARKQGAYSVVASNGQVLKRGQDLARVVDVLNKKVRLVVS